MRFSQRFNFHTTIHSFRLFCIKFFIVKCAEDRCKDEKRWEYVYCVFDKDTHAHFKNAYAKAKSLDEKHTDGEGQPVRFIPIISVPCFELWIALHFAYISAEHTSREIQNKLKNAERLAKQKKRGNTENPFTSVDQLVKHLLKLGAIKPPACAAPTKSAQPPQEKY